MVSYEALSARGAVVRTFDCVNAARRWAAENKDTFPGLRIDAVERIESRRRIWSDRASLRLVG